MTAIETDIPTITPLHREALRIRHAAVQPLLKQIKSPEEGIDLLLAVVWPSDPLLGLDSSTLSATEPSSHAPSSADSVEGILMPEGHDLRLCKVPSCPNECGREVPTTGSWANVCTPCRNGETPEGVIYLELHRAGRPRKPASLRTQLTPSEVAVLIRLSEGDSNAEIAKALTLSTETIKTYIRNLLWKLAVKNRTHAVAYALRTGLIQ